MVLQVIHLLSCIAAQLSSSPIYPVNEYIAVEGKLSRRRSRRIQGASDRKWVLGRKTFSKGGGGGLQGIDKMRVVGFSSITFTPPFRWGRGIDVRIILLLFIDWLVEPHPPPPPPSRYPFVTNELRDEEEIPSHMPAHPLTTIGILWKFCFILSSFLLLAE